MEVKKKQCWFDDRGNEYQIVKKFNGYNKDRIVTVYIGLKRKGEKWPFQLTVDELIENYKPS